ncbi:MAG: SLC13 family permease [Blastocatellia bacterium]|nr:SLC13 family permease [Blastocatellia bacterium]
MNPALASLLALIAAIVLSMVSRINIGLVAIGLAWLVGVYIAGIKPDAVMAGFPATLFLTLTGVTLLFACAESNGALRQLGIRAVGLVRGNRRLLPLLFFLIAFALSTVGPGAISSVALVAPLAMAIGERARLSRFLTALMVANGANAGNLSPISSVGVIANTKMAEAGLGAHAGKVWFSNFAAHALVAVAAYVALHRKEEGDAASERGDDAASERRGDAASELWSRNQKITAIAILVWIVGVLALKLSLGLSAFAATGILIFAGATEEKEAIRLTPWSVILMVCGVSLLIAMLEKTGGLDLFTGMLARLASPASVNGVIAFVTGTISTYSSTSGVVLPAFLPMAPRLVGEMGGGDPLAIALSINVGSALVDVSPLSTLGALCVAAVGDPAAAQPLFRKLLFWGLSMTVVGAVLCQLFAGLIAGM